MVFAGRLEDAVSLLRALGCEPYESTPPSTVGLSSVAANILGKTQMVWLANTPANLERTLLQGLALVGHELEVLAHTEAFTKGLRLEPSILRNLSLDFFVSPWDWETAKALLSQYTLQKTTLVFETPYLGNFPFQAERLALLPGGTCLLCLEPHNLKGLGKAVLGLHSSPLTSFSHEVRTPLNSLLGYAQLLEMVLPSGEASDYAHHLSQAAYDLSVAVESLIGLQKRTAGLASDQPPLSLRVLGQQLEKSLAPVAKHRQVELRFSPADDTTWLDNQNGIGRWLTTMGLALLQRIPAGGWLAFKASRRNADGQVVLSLSAHWNHPTPKPNRSQAEVLNKRFQLAQTLAAQLGGSLEVFSAGKNSLDLRLELPSQTSKLSPYPTPHTPKATTLAYIEDDESNFRVLATAAKHWGAELLHANGLAQAKRLLSHQTPQVILLDWHIPSPEEGLACLQWLRSKPALSQVPILVMSADASPEVKEQALSHGATMFINKPVDLHVLHHYVEAGAHDTP